MKAAFKVREVESGKVTTWSMEDVLEEINRDRSAGWEDYDHTDWREGWYEWVEGEFYTLVSVEGEV